MCGYIPNHIPKIFTSFTILNTPILIYQLHNLRHINTRTINKTTKLRNQRISENQPAEKIFAKKSHPVVKSEVSIK